MRGFSRYAPRDGPHNTCGIARLPQPDVKRGSGANTQRLSSENLSDVALKAYIEGGGGGEAGRAGGRGRRKGAPG
jgi:hypothetical protein